MGVLHAKIQRAQVLIAMVSFHPEQPSEEPTDWVDDLANDGALLYSDVDDEV